MALRILAQQHEVAIIRNQHKPVTVPVAAYLYALGSQPGVVTKRLDLDYTPLRQVAGRSDSDGFPLSRTEPDDLRLNIEAEIGMPRALVGHIANTVNLGLERVTDGI